ncbi:hypothetical protein [Amycolatopsis sp. BJA-103]|uniref:hypothetical protein n=1 Tax=unclassified Amycolatopsis TaxID=2618356 RepID=UPI000C75A906|nr:hypothetical protein [Amycolatopsis sp. BJA-103]
MTGEAVAEAAEGREAVVAGALELLLVGAVEVPGTAEGCGDALPAVCSSHPTSRNRAAAAKVVASGRIVMVPPVEVLLTGEE